MNPVSLQLWTLNENTTKDFAGTVAEVAKIGYKAVELAGTGNLKPAEAAHALESAGLQVSGMHIGWESLTEKFDGVVADALRFKTTEIILPGIDRYHFASRESCLALGETLGELGAKFRTEGLKLSYHNHDQEFAIRDGRPALEWMLEACSPQDVSAQVDLFWVAAAGQDPVKAVSRLGTRARLLHIKDGIDQKQADLGKGNIGFPSIFKFTKTNNLTDWYVVEQEEFEGTRIESVRRAFIYLTGLRMI